LAYMIFRRHPSALMGCLALCVLMYVGDKSGAFDRLELLRPVRQWVSFGSLLGVHPTMALVGVVVGLLFVPGSGVAAPWPRICWMLVFAGGLFFAGFLLRPLYGCWKGAETPTWAIYSTAISCLIFAGLYAIVDVWKVQWWAAPLIPAGSNPLLAYMLADLAYPLVMVMGISMSASGAVGILRTLCFALGLILLTSWLTAKEVLRLRV